MLALTRKKGTSIMIGNDIEVTVLGIQGEQVNLELLHQKTFLFIEKKSFFRYNKKMQRRQRTQM